MLIARFPPVVGGAEIQCFRLSTWLSGQGHTVLVLTEKSSPQQPSRERVNGFDVIRFWTCGKPPVSSFLYGIQAFFYLLTHQRFDVLHVHMLATPAMVASLVSPILKTPVLIKIAGGRATGDFGTSKRSILGKLKLWFFKRGKSHVVCPSPETQKEAEAFGITENRLSFIPNGVDIEQFKPSTEAIAKLRTSLQWPSEAPIAIYVGRWAKGKGVETLLDLWDLGVKRPDFPWHLAMILSEPPPDHIASRINHLKSKINLIVRVESPIPYYQASDLAVLLSEGEGMSNFLLEAMASGLPTLTTQAAALPDMHGEDTGTFTLENAASVDQALDVLLELSRNRTRLPEWGCLARQHIQNHYAFESVGPAYQTLYHKIQHNV